MTESRLRYYAADMICLKGEGNDISFCVKLALLHQCTMVQFEGSCDPIYLKMRKWPYLSPGAKNG